MRMDYRCSNIKCSRPAELLKKSVGRNWNSIEVTSKKPIKICPVCRGKVELLSE